MHAGRSNNTGEELKKVKPCLNTENNKKKFYSIASNLLTSCDQSENMENSPPTIPPLRIRILKNDSKLQRVSILQPLHDNISTIKSNNDPQTTVNRSSTLKSNIMQKGNVNSTAHVSSAFSYETSVVLQASVSAKNSNIKNLMGGENNAAQKLSHDNNHTNDLKIFGRYFEGNDNVQVVFCNASTVQCKHCYGDILFKGTIIENDICVLHKERWTYSK